MITPLDIQSKEFAKSVRGYKEEDVDGFLDLLTLDWEKMIEENQRLKDQVKSLSADLSVLETLEAAKALMGDISASAEKRAEILLKNAELDAERITREARESVEKLNEEAVAIRSSLNTFKTRYKLLLESELEKFDTLSAELFADKDMEDLKSILEGRTPFARQFKEDDTDFSGKTLINIRTGDGI